MRSDLVRQGCAIRRWPASNNVGDEDVSPTQFRQLEQHIQQTARPAYERHSFPIFGTAWTLTDQHDISVACSKSGHDLSSSSGKLTACAAIHGSKQRSQ